MGKVILHGETGAAPSFAQTPDVAVFPLWVVERDNARGSRCWLGAEPPQVTAVVRYKANKKGSKVEVMSVELRGLVGALVSQDRPQLARIIIDLLAQRTGAVVTNAGVGERIFQGEA